MVARSNGSPAIDFTGYRQISLTYMVVFIRVTGGRRGYRSTLRSAARSELMRQIAALVKARKWTQAEAAEHCDVTQPRINDLLRGRVSRFSLDALVNISAALGCRVRMEIEAVRA